MTPEERNKIMKQQLGTIAFKDYPELEQLKVSISFGYGRGELHNCRVVGCCGPVGITVVDEGNQELICLNGREFHTNEFGRSGCDYEEVFKAFVKGISEGLIDYRVINDYFGISVSNYGGRAGCAFK